jgi:TonB-linked SusC/RagA family outer membrane protein
MMREFMQSGRHPNCRKLVFSFLLLAFSIAVHAQVTGRVTNDSGRVVPGVSVVVKGKSSGTTTDEQGNYRINAAGTDVLLFSSVGYTSSEVRVSGRTKVDVALVASNESLTTVVVTALGITKQARGIGYATSTVKPEELTVNRTANPINALQGKIPGLNISSLGTGPGGTAKIRIRGEASLTGGSPLIVVDGVPFDNSNFNGNTVGVNGGGVTSDGGDGLSSINPDDIESMTVLKGGPAAALYGSRASGGVIMITTKTKGRNKGIGVSINSNYTSDTPLDYTDYQTVYGQGEGGVRPTTINPTSGQWSFGEKIQPGMTQILYNNLTVPYELQPSRIKNFYRQGSNFSNTVSLESSNEKGGFHLSLNNTDNLGIMPNNSLNRKVLNIGYNYTLSKAFSFSGTINYSREYNKNPPNIANQDNSIPTTLMALSTTMPLSVLEANAKNSLGNEYPWSRFTNRTNPYFVLSDQFHNIKRDRVFGNVAMKYNILPWWYIQGRVGQDYYSRDEDVNNFPTGQASRQPAIPGFVNGVYTQESRRFRESNIDFLSVANHSFGAFDATLTVGGNQMRQRIDINNVQVTDFVVRGYYTVKNGRAKNPIYDLREKGVNSIYGAVDLSWNRTLYLSGTVREDWFSTLARENNGIIYPSVSGSYVFTESFKSLPRWLNFGKIRAGYSEVGSDGSVDPYADQLYYSVNSNTINNPLGTAVTVGNSGAVLPNKNLRPLRIKETEAGIELKMFNNRVSLEATVYKKITIDQIISVQISDGSGFTSTLVNSGQSTNKGFEGMINLGVVQSKNFRWDFIANGSYNITKVDKLTTSKAGERFTTGNHPFNGEVRLVVGQEIGQIAGYGYARDAKGNRIFQSNGLPQRTADLVLFGSGLPKWTGGFTNNFSYKRLTLSVFVDYKLGGKMLSGTNFNAIRHGLHKITLEGREGGVTGQGVNAAGQPNTVVAAVQTYWEHLRSQQIVEPVIYNAGYWKLRQITLGYDFTRFVPAKWPIKGLKLDLVANNVLIIKKWVDNIDPESVGYGTTGMVGLESPGLPTVRSLGANLNIKF